MIMMGLEFTGSVPFSDVCITSVIQAPDGRRMSKSLGTGIDPLAEIDKHGADAVRFGLLAMGSSQDVKYSDEKIRQGQDLANKLFNAARFAILSMEPGALAEARPTAIEDRWILSRLARIDRVLDERFASYDFPHAALDLYDFIYGELCDWYIELVKPRFSGGQSLDLSSTLRFVLRETLQIAHPLIPFVTEEMWSYVREDGEGLLAGHLRTPLPDALLDPEAESAIEQMITATQAIRSWRDGVKVKPGERVVARIEASGYDDIAQLIAQQARLELRERDSNGSEPQATVAIPGGAIAILEGIDLAAQEDRAAKRRELLRAEIARAKAKLDNPAFIAKAPANVVEKEQQKLRELEEEFEVQ
ncbi:MAG TPA: class I tRNA ligase family protein, partial [Solirubrobacteraceae bacterium]|nr:class I tRNA ligase family protein [Solirubrobacteraceae bacterium]